MGRYEGTARKIAQQIAATQRQKAEEQKSIVETGNGMVGDLVEYADDQNTALKQIVPDLPAKLEATPWRQDGNAILGTLSVTNNGHTRDIRVIVPIGGGEATVGGVAARSPMEAVYTEVVKILNPPS